MNSFDPTKPVRTRDGRPARIVATDCKSAVGDDLLIVALHQINRSEIAKYHSLDGRLNGRSIDSPTDLVNYDPFEITDEEAELMVNFFVRKGYFVHASVPNAIRIRNREWGATLNETCPDAKYLRDAIIANRKSQ